MAKDKKTVEEQFQKLSQREQIYLRPGTYIGSIKNQTINRFSFKDGKFESELVTYNPGILKLFDEAIVNCVDEHKRKGSKLNTVKVTIKDNRITVLDNGGIVVQKHKVHNQYVPEFLFSDLNSGSNYDDTEERTGAGLNGLGMKLVNIFSKEFSVSTCDGKNSFYQICKNNLTERSKPVIKKSTKNHTEISFVPDYKRFEMDGLDEANFNMIKKRVYDIAGCNPSMKIYFNDEQIKIKTFEDYTKFYTNDCIFETSGGWSFAVAKSENGFQQVSFVNSVDTYDGGTHVEYVLAQIVEKLKEFFLKKHKVDVKPSDIKNHMFLFLNATVINPSFTSQTKEKLDTKVKDFGFTCTVSQKFIDKILKSEIVASILDWIMRKKEAEENALLRKANKAMDKVKVEKLIDAKGKDRNKCVLMLMEGDSAMKASRKYLDPNTQGAFAMKGKFTNVTDITATELLKDKEAVDLMASIGLKLGAKPIGLRYGKILIYTDQDVDGMHICSLLLNFFYKYWSELFDQKRIYKAETPIVVVKNKKQTINFYTNEEYQEWLSKTKDVKSWDISYKKGLAALKNEEYQEIIQNPRLTLITKDDMAEKYLDIWFADGEEFKDQKKKVILG